MKNESSYKVLGLDIGIGSCGWAILDTAQEKIIDMGVHLWDVPQESKTKESLAAGRRAARATRRNIKRTADRKKHCLKLFQQYGLVPADTGASWLQTVSGDLQPLESRKAGLDRMLSDREFAQALYNICARRGYIPHGESSNESDTEGRKVLSAIQANSEKMNECGYRTVGEMLYASERSRNKSGNYDLCVTNQQLCDEAKVLFNQQRKFDNAKATEEFEKDYLACLTWMHDNADNDERIYSQVGKCVYFPEEFRAAKACLSFEMCKAFENVNHTVVIRTNGQEEKLPADIKQRVIETLFSPLSLPGNKDCKVTYGTLRKWLDLQAYDSFKNIDGDKEKTREICEPKVWRFLRKSLSPDLMCKLLDNRVLADDVCAALTYASSLKSLETQIIDLDLSNTERDQILTLPYSSKLFSGYGTRSLKALNLLIDAFEDYERITTLADAEQASGLKDKRLDKPNKRKKLPPYITFDETCKNPVVLRVMGRVRKIINAVIDEYGMPNEIHIELARELKQSKKEKDKIAKSNRAIADAREGYRKELSELKGCLPEDISVALLMKYELYLEQGEMDIYSGKPIDKVRLINDDKYCEIDHILPYSRTCDDSRSNKVVVLAESNQNKRERSPYEWKSEDGTWEEFKARVNSLHYGFTKKNKLLETKLSEKQAEFIERNLNDTRYASRAAMQYIDEYLEFPEGPRMKHVVSVAGAGTAALRSAWGFAKKDRELNDCHHAIDAAVIAACTDAIVIKLAKASEQKHYVPKEERKKLFEDTEPWADFSQQVEAYAADVIPTRKVDHGYTGRLFQEMVYSFKGVREDGKKGILSRSGKETPSGNYVVRDDGSALLPDGMVFLRLWWDEESKHYLPEPVYYSDIHAIANGSYIPRYISSTPRNQWRIISDDVLQGKPLILYYGDMISLNGNIGRYKTLNISGLAITAADAQSFSRTIQIGTFNSVRSKNQLFIISENILHSDAIELKQQC